MEDVKVEKYLLSKKIPPNIKGFKYMATAIKMCQRDEKYLYSLTTKLYPSIAKLYGDKTVRTERALRTALTYLDEHISVGCFIGIALIELKELCSIKKRGIKNV